MKDSNPISLPSSHKPRKKLKLRETIAPWDKANLNNPQGVALYAESIMNLYIQMEVSYMPNENYMDQQEDLSWEMREILCEWLLEVHYKYKLVDEVIFLCLSIVDRYLSQVNIKRENLQLLGVAALLIASKYEEIYPPSLKKFLYLCQESYTRSEVLALEGDILTKLEFKLCGPSANKFFERIVDICKLNEKARMIGKMAIFLSLLDRNLLKFK